jgi:membrane protease YdiL (CAAX protease family)
LLPLLAFHELVSLTRPQRVVASVMLQKFLELFGPMGVWAPGVAVVVILLATHLASGKRWTIRWKHVGVMYAEAALLAIPLLALNWAMPLSASQLDPQSLIDQLALGVGAGVYEELMFRLIFISMAMMIGADLLRLNRTRTAIVSAVLSALVFAAHHHQPIGAEPFEFSRFAFRSIAGLYLALIFWYRGYGPAAGCHAAYNVALVLKAVPVG